VRPTCERYEKTPAITKDTDVRECRSWNVRSAGPQQHTTSKSVQPAPEARTQADTDPASPRTRLASSAIVRGSRRAQESTFFQASADCPG
jgi:hypothetical protein